MALRDNDLRVLLADAALEVAIASMLAGDDSMTRKLALRFLSKRVLRKDVTDRMRVRTATTT